ncbi:hypothetical protein K6I34_006267, partial [Streptomyces sp. UNOC14_S4]|nr:hypothetical protein [Streptomyces sp. UNOC14_S4]
MKWMTRQHLAIAATAAAAGFAVTTAHPASAASAAPVGASSRADYQAVAHPVVGRVGQTVEVELGVRNGGPGGIVARGGHGAGTAGTYEVIPPEGTTITAARPAEGNRQPCVAKTTPGGPAAYVCSIGADFPAGDEETLRFQVRIDRKVDGARGRVS